jgi:hypothetical protein
MVLLFANTGGWFTLEEKGPFTQLFFAVIEL